MIYGVGETRVSYVKEKNNSQLRACVPLQMFLIWQTLSSKGLCPLATVFATFHFQNQCSSIFTVLSTLSVKMTLRKLIILVFCIF